MYFVLIPWWYFIEIPVAYVNHSICYVRPASYNICEKILCFVILIFIKPRRFCVLLLILWKLIIVTNICGIARRTHIIPCRLASIKPSQNNTHNSIKFEFKYTNERVNCIALVSSCALHQIALNYTQYHKSLSANCLITKLFAV